MDTKYKIVTEIRCSTCNKHKNITTEILAPREDVALSWASKHVEKSSEFAAFELEHSKHKELDKYRTIGEYK